MSKSNNPKFSIDMDDYFKKLQKDGKNSVDGLIKWLTDDMEELFEKLKRSGKNSIDGIIQWMKEAKIIDGIKVTEEKAREVFADVVDPKNVNLDKFKEALTKLATDQKKNLEDFSKTLAEQAPRVLDALQAGACAFKDALSKK